MSLHLKAGEGFHLNQKAYYNAKRSSVKVTAEDRINQMLKELATAGFHTRSRWIRHFGRNILSHQYRVSLLLLM